MSGSIIVITGATTEHTSPHHDVSHHGDSMPQKKHQNTIVPFGIQKPGHVLATQDVACISADSNIFEIMNKAQETCNGTDMRCTFYHFVNHEYQNIGTLNIDKELFDDLLMKFDNWLLTAESIEKFDDEDGKTKKDSSLDSASINVNGSYSNEEQNEHSTNVNETERLYTNEGIHIDKVDHNTNESYGDEIVNTHHIKIFDKTHHRNHHDERKNGNHIKLVPEYNNDHRYFEVFLPKDRETGKPRTIYVEVDRDKNEFVLLDEEIEKKLNGIKPIRIELDELSEIADTAFNTIAKSSNHKQHVDNSNDDDRIMTSDINTNSVINENTTNLVTDVAESPQNILNPSICNINANQQIIPNNTTGNSKKIVNVSKNLAVPNKYINQAQYYAESHVDNIPDEIPNDHLKLLENTNATDTHQTGFHEETPLDTIEFNENNTSIDVDLDNIECSVESFDVPCEYDDDNSTDSYELSTEDENVTLDDDSFIELGANNDTSIDIDFDDTHDFSSTNKLYLNEPVLQAEKPKLTSPLTAGISDFIGSQLYAIPSENRERPTYLQDYSAPPGRPSSQYTTVPLLGKDLAKVLETDFHLKSSFPAYATLDIPADASQNTPLNSDLNHPSITSYNNSPLDIEQKTNRLKISNIVPALNVDIQEPSLTTEPYHLEADTLMPPKSVTPSKLYLPKSNNDQFSETPLSVMPDSFKDAVKSPCPMQQIPFYLQSTKPNQDLGYIKYSPFDNNSMETMIPCSPCQNRYPYTSIPFFANPFLKPPQFTPPYLEPLLPVASLQPTSKIPTFDSLPISLDQSYPYINGDYPRETKQISLLPNTAFSSVNPQLVGTSFVPNTLPFQNLWNNIPFLPYTMLPDQNIRNYAPIGNNYLTPSAVLQQNQILKPLLSKTDSLSVSDEPCSIENIVEMAPPSCAPFSPVYTPPMQMNLNPLSALERDLQILSLKYGIPLSKILNSLETEISDAHSKTSLQTLKAPYSNLVHDSSLISNPILSKTNAVLDDENRSGYEESPLDSSLIGPHLELESSLIRESNDSQSYTVLSETTILPSSYSSFENEPTKVLKDSSLIGPHLSTLSTSDFVVSNENRNANDVLLSESDISNLSLPLDSSLMGPHLEIGSPPIVSDSFNSQGEILTSQTEIPVTISSQIEPKLNIQNQSTSVLLDSSLIGSHLPSLSAVKPLLSDDIQIINGMIPVETDRTDLTLLDSALIHTQEDLVKQLDQSKILQHQETAITLSAADPSIKLHKTTEYLSSNITEDEFILESDSSVLIPLDSSLVGPGLKLEHSPIIVNAAEDKTVPEISLDSLQNTDNKVEELESIILPSSLLPTLLNADSNLNIITHETNLNEELDESSLDTDLELPLTDISLIPFKETDFKILEPIPELPSLLDDSNISLPAKDSRNLKHTSKSEITHVVDSGTVLDSSLIGPSILHKSDNPEISTSLDSSIQSILQDIDSQEISPILDSVNHVGSSLAVTTINKNKKPSEILLAVDSSIQVESSLLGPTLHHEINSKETSTAFDAFDKSLVPILHDTTQSSTTTSVLNSSQLDSSLIDPSLHQGTPEVARDFDSKYLLDSLLVGPQLSTLPFSSDGIQMINEELQPESGLANLILLDSSLVGPHVDFDKFLVPSLHETKEASATTSVLNSSQLDSSLIGPNLNQGTLGVSRAFDSKDLLDSSLIDPQLSTVPFSSDEIQMINEELQPELGLTNLVLLDSSLVGPHVDFEKSLVPSLHETKESSATIPVLNSSQLDSSLIGPNLNQGKLEVSRAFDSKDLLDSSLEGPHLSTLAFSSDEIQMINEELQLESDLANLVPWDSSLVGPHVNFESELKQSEISRYQNPESSLTSVTDPDVCETIELPCDLVEGVSPLETITLSLLSTSELQELLSKFTNALTKSQLSSVAKISSDNKNISPSCTDLQTLTEYSPITMTSPTHEFSPVGPFVKLPPCLDSNYYPTPKTSVESLLYAQGVPQIPITPYSPFIQKKPLIDRNWLPQPLNFQNMLQTSPSFRPVVGNAPVPFISNALIPLTPEDFQPFLDLASHSNLYPQLSMPYMYTPGDAIAPSSEWITPSNILPLDKYSPLLSKTKSLVLPSNLQPTISNSEYSPIVLDDIMSLLDENSYQLLKDMSNLPFSQSFLPPSIPVFEKSEIVSPSLLDTIPILNSDFINTRPLLPIPITNPLVPLSICNSQIGVHNPYMIQTPNISPCNLQSYSNISLHSQFSEIIGPEPKLITLPTESPKVFLQQLLSKPCVESPIMLPSSSLDTMLQLPTASNELNSVPRQLPPKYFTPISPIYTTPLSNVITNPMLPIYASPLSVYCAKPISKPSTSLPLNVPYIDSPLTPLPLPFNPCITRPLTPKYSSPVMPLEITPISDHPYSPIVAQNRPIPSEIPYNPSQSYSSPYLPIHASHGSPNIMSKLPPTMTRPISPVFYEPLSTPYFSSLPKSLTNLGLPAYSGPLAPISLNTLAPTPTGLLSPSYQFNPDIITDSYSSLPAPINTKRSSNLLTPAYITPISPVSSSLSSYNTPLSSNQIFNLNPQMTAPELQSKLLNTLPISNAVNPFLNANQWLQSHPTYVPKPLSSPSSNSQIKQNLPCEHASESNLLTSLTEEIPTYDVVEESTYTYSNDKEAKFYEESKLKYPLESLSYTLAPEETTEALLNEDFIKQEDITPSAPVNNHASEPSLQTKLYQHLRLTPYSTLHDEPHPAPQLLPPSSFTESIFDNIRPVQSSRPLKHPVSLPTSILTSALLKPLTPLTSASNFPISSPLLPTPCTDTSLNPYNILPMNKKLLIYSPYYSATSQDISSPPIDPRELKNIVTPEVTSGFSQVPTNAPIGPVLSPKSQPLIWPYILDNYIQLPLTLYEPKSKTLTSQGSLDKPSSIPHYNQYVKPIISQFPPFQMPITPQYITPLTPPQNLKKTKPVFSLQYVSSVSPGQITLQDSLLSNETPIHCHPYIPEPAALTSSINNIFKSPPVTLPYTVLSSVNMVERESTDLNNKPVSSPFTPQYSLSSSFSPVLLSSPIVSHSNVPHSRFNPHIPKQELTNHIIPSSLFMSCDTNFQTPTNKLSINNIARKSYPSSSQIEPLEKVPKSPLSSVQYEVPLSLSPYFPQPLRPTDSYQTQPLTNAQYTTKLHPKLSPVQGQYAASSSSPMYTSLPSETVPMQIKNTPNAPQYSLPYVPVYDTPIHLSPSGRKPFINPDFKPITEVPSYSIPENIISTPTLTPTKNIVLLNLRPQDISQEPHDLYFSPITSSALVKTLPQKSLQYQPLIIPNYSQYISQLPIDSVPQLLPSSSPLLKSPLLKPLFTSTQNNVPLLSMHFSNTNTAFPEVFPIEADPSVTSPDIARSNYLPSDFSYHKYSDPLVSEIPEIVTPINLSATTPYTFLKSPFNKHFKSPVSTLTNIPLYSNNNILEPSPKHSIRANIVNTAKPVEVSAISAPESSPISLNSLDTETIEEMEPYEPKPDLKDRFSQLTLSQNQQRQLHPIFNSEYLPRPQPSHARLPFLNRISPISSSNIPSFNTPSLLCDEAELIDTTDFIPMSEIKPEPLISNFDSQTSLPGVSSTDRKAPIPYTLSNIPEPDILQLPPYITLLNTEFHPPTYKQFPPKLQTPRFNNKIPQPSPIYLNAQEYKDLIHSPSPSQASLSSPTVLSSINIDPQLTTNLLTAEPRPIPLTQLYNNPMSIIPENWLPSPIFKNSLPFHEKPLEVIQENGRKQTLLNKYRPANKITPLDVNNYPYEPEYSIMSEVRSELDSIRSVTPLIKSKQHSIEYIEHLEPNEENDYDPESDNVSLDENQLKEARPTKNLPEIIKGLSVPNYNKIAHRPQILSKLDHFYANNHIIGKSPQVFTVPTYNTLPATSSADVISPSSFVCPEIFKDFTNIPTRHFGSVPKLDNNSLMPNEYYPEIADSPENVPITNSYPQNYLNPCLKYSSQMKSPLNTIEITDTSEISPTSYSPNNNIDDIKYLGYKTYQIPSFKCPKMAHNLGTPTQRYSPSDVTYSSSNDSKVQQIPISSHFYRPTEISKPHIPQYQTPIKMTTPLQTKSVLDTLQDSSELNEYIPIEDIPISVENINEDNELKTSLINYINKREHVKNNLFGNNAELTIPIGNIAITRKEPYNANTIETNNPSIGLKAWKSNVKIAKAEIKLKFKDLSVNNFMPIVNNSEKYDMEEIREIVKNYIDEKYGKHIEINEPYTIDNKYTVITDFDHNAVDNKYNLLWPTNYV